MDCVTKIQTECPDVRVVYWHRLNSLANNLATLQPCNLATYQSTNLAILQSCNMLGTHVLHWLGPPVLRVIIWIACSCAMSFCVATLVIVVAVQLCLPVYILGRIPALASYMTDSPKLTIQMICAHTLATLVLVFAAVAVYVVVDFCSANAYVLVGLVWGSIVKLHLETL